MFELFVQIFRNFYQNYYFGKKGRRNPEHFARNAPRTQLFFQIATIVIIFTNIRKMRKTGMVIEKYDRNSKILTHGSN